jgi:LmbE family N-acetylglucosaminyl deacetylase
MTNGGAAGTAGSTSSGGQAGSAGSGGAGGAAAGSAGSGGTGGDGGSADGGGNAGAAGHGGDGGSATDGGNGGSDAGRCAAREIRIVAHQDDELLFMNPDLLESLRAGRCVRTVYLTAGDAGKGIAYAATRDAGMRAVYASMAGRADTWTESSAVFGGKTLPISSLQDEDVSLIFLRLPDGGDGTGFPATGQQSLTKLVAGTLTSIRAVDDSNAFTRAELVATLAEIVTSYRADVVAIQEFADEFGGDHPDHVAGGAIANDAQTKYTAQHRVIAYRGYDTVVLPSNLPPAIADENWRLFLDYARHDENVCPGGVCPAPGARPTQRVLGLYYDWCRQQFPYFKGSVIGLGGKCLTVRGSAGTAGAPVELQPCSAADEQRWTFTAADEHLKALGLCLEVGSGGTSSGTVLQMAACQNVPQQRWSYAQVAVGDAGLTTTRFKSLTGKCMNVRTSLGSTPTVDTADCDPTSAQQGFWYYAGH